MKRKSLIPLLTPLGISHDLPTFQKLFPSLEWASPSRFPKTAVDIRSQLQKTITPYCLAPIRLEHLKSLAEDQCLLPLDDLFTPHDLHCFAPSSLEISRFKGRLYAIPDDMETFAFISRVDLLEKFKLSPPTTWKALGEQLKILSKAGFKHPLRVFGSGPNPRIGFLLSLLGSAGIDLSGNLNEWIPFRKSMIQAYDWNLQWIKKGYFKEMDYFLHELPRAEPDVCQDDEVIFYMAWPGAFFYSLKKLSGIYDKIHLSPFPRESPKIPSWAPIRGHGWIIPKNTSHPELGITTLHAIQKVSLRKKFELTKGYPFISLKNLWHDTEILQRHPIYRWSDALFPKTQRFHLLDNDPKLQVLDESFRRAIIENLSGEEWVRSIFSRELSTARQVTVDRTVSQAMEYVHLHFREIKNIHEVASRMKLSSSYFRRLFKKKMKIGFNSYLMQVRMEEARKHLQSRTQSIKEVAASVGFRDASIFARAFRRHWKTSPSEVLRKGSR